MKKEHRGLLGLLNPFSKSSMKKQTEEANQNQADDTDHSPASRNSDQPYLPKIGKRHQLVGLNYREGSVMKLAKDNPLYKLDKATILKQGLSGTYIHKFLFKDGPTELIQEPDNPHDPYAIKVVVAGQHIGYIKAGSCAHLNRVIEEGRVQQILCRISGGPYKGVFQNIDEALDAGFAGKPTYVMETGTEHLRAEIRVVEAPSKK